MSVLTRIQAELLAGSRLFSQQEAQSVYGCGTEGIQRRIAGAIKVSDHAEVATVLKFANQLAGTEEAFSLFPISSGNNWGYGSSLPHNDTAPAVILDLSALKKIPFFDAELGLVTVQPGVTQIELRAYLDANGGAHYMVPVTGAGPNCSLMGNALERGYGITPHMDHFAAVNSMKGYLPDGSFYQSALCELDRSETEIADKCFKWGIGPYLEGLFTQSGLGVMTEMTFRLREKPAGFDSFYLRFKADEDFELIVKLVADILREQEGVVGAINIMDRRRVISMMAPNPNGPEQHRVMTEAQVNQLAKDYDIPAWTVAGSLYGSRRVVSAARKDIKARLSGVKCQALFSSGLLIKAGRMAVNLAPAWLLKKERGMVAALDKGIEIMRGVPNEVAMPLSYWRTPRPTDTGHLNPARDRCGLLWYAPLVPMRPHSMRALVELVRSVCPKHNIEPMVTLTNFHHDCADSTIPILFNQAQPTAAEDAKNCLNELVAEGLELGLVPYRLNIAQQQSLDFAAPSWVLVRKMGELLDPNRVLMPGRYGK